MKLIGLAALFALGALVSGVVATVGGAQTSETTTATATVLETTTEATTVQETTTAPATTVVTTETATETATVAPTTTEATTATDNGGTATWVWVVLALLAAAVVGLLVALLTRRHGAATLPDDERRRRLQNAIASWTAQGWATLSETSDAAVLQRGTDRMTVSVDAGGHISTQALTTPPPSS